MENIAHQWKFHKWIMKILSGLKRGQVWKKCVKPKKFSRALRSVTSLPIFKQIQYQIKNKIQVIGIVFLLGTDFVW